MASLEKRKINLTNSINIEIFSDTLCNLYYGISGEEKDKPN